MAEYDENDFVENNFGLKCSKSSNLVFMRGSICLQNIKTQPFLQKRMKKQDIEHWGEKQADPVRHLGRCLKSASS